MPTKLGEGEDFLKRRPYRASFVFKPEPIPYAGASLPAFTKLLGGRGYRLVGVERLGFNTIFVRNDLAPKFLAEVTADECFRQPIASIFQEMLVENPRLGAFVKSQPWIEV